ncbi:MAG: 4Fe-4S dicluster domain-containing protein [Planctomycetota bacterium]
MNKVLLIDPDKCTSCRLCELACSGRTSGTYRPARALIRLTIDTDEAFYFPRVCIQCDDAPCMETCPEEALVRDSWTNAVVVLADKCTNCGLCVESCPYGVIYCEDDVARKCDLCGGDPECVRFCGPGALQFVPADEWPDVQRLAYADRLQALAAEVKS